MAGRRRHNSSVFSLFSFQDIITSVTGVLILLTLLLTLELVQRKSAPAVMTSRIVDQLQSAIARNQLEIDELRGALSKQRLRMMRVAGVNPESAQNRLSELERQKDDLRERLEKATADRNRARDREVAARREEAREVGREQVLQKVREELDKKRRALQRLKESNRMIFNPSQTAGKKPWLIEVTDTSFTAAEWGASAPPRVFSSITELTKFAASQQAESTYFVLLVKPNGIHAFEVARRGLEAAGFDVGFDLVGSDQTAIDPMTGVAVE